MKSAALSFLLLSISAMANDSAIKLPDYLFKESKLANYTPPNWFTPNFIAMVREVKKPVEQFGQLYTPTFANKPGSAASEAALLSALTGVSSGVEFEAKYLVKNNDQYTLWVQPMIGPPTNLFIEHYLQVDTKYNLLEQNGVKTHRFSFGESRVIDARPWTQKLAMYTTPELSVQTVDQFFANTSVFHKTSVANNDCKQLQSDIRDIIPNFGTGNGLLERQVGLMDKSAVLFKIKIDKKNRVDFAIDPQIKNGQCQVYIQSYATAQQENGFDFDAQIAKTVTLVEQLASKQKVDLSTIEVIEPKKPETRRGS